MSIDLLLPLTIFIAGVVTSFLPCTFPLIIGYIGLMVGDEKNSNIISSLLKLFFFFVGFTFTFVLFGTVAGFFGQFSDISLFSYNLRPFIADIGGIIFIIIGLILLQKIPLPNFLRLIKSIPLPKKILNTSSPFASIVIGIIFAAGWSPCIGPILGGVLVLAASSGSVFFGAFYLAIFSIGIFTTLFMLMVIYLISSKHLRVFESFIPIVSAFSGILFILLGIGFITGYVGILTEFTPTFISEKYL